MSREIPQAREAIVNAMRTALRSSHPGDFEVGDAILAALRSLPVEERAAAVGFVKVEQDYQDAHYEDGTYVDGPVWAPAQGSEGEEP